jgi:hypothetical protein
VATGRKSAASFSDEESRSIIYEGATLTQLGAIFKMDHRTVVRKLQDGNVKPHKVAKNIRGQDVELYSIADAAVHLVKPIIDVEKYITTMDHRDLPKMLTKEYWAGQRSRQMYEENAGLLWRTEKVVEEVGELMKLFKMNTLLLNDAVERQTELSERQREIIRSLTNGALKDLVKRIDDKFKVVAPDVQRQETEDDEEL